MNYQTQFLPTGNALCPTGGCRFIDPSQYQAGLPSLVATVVRIAQGATYVIAALSILFIIYAAFQFLIGGEKGAEKGRKIIINAIIAIIIAALSFTGVALLVNVLDTFRL
jgi:hypothetical protein